MRLIITATAAGLLALTLTACATSTPATDLAPAPTTHSTASAPAPAPKAHVSEPSAVADEVARTYWATDTSTDKTPADAATRAARWLTPAYTAIATQALPGGAGADWLTLAEHHGHTVVTLVPGDDIVPGLPADTATTATRVRILTLTPTGVDGWSGTPQQLVATLTLTRTDDASPWLVSGITVDEPLAGMPTDDQQSLG